MKKKERTYSGTKNPEMSLREKKNRALARRAASEGIALLKNEGLLPLKEGSCIALFGSGAGRTIKGGTGSGDVNERDQVSIWQGMKNAGFQISSEGWLEDYESRYQQAREDWKNQIITEAGKVSVNEFFQVYASHAFRMPDGRDITEQDFAGADTALYVISRVAGEGADRKEEAGDYYLTKKETEDLKQICSLCRKVAVVINAGGQMDLAALRELPQIKALLYIAQAGMEGGNALADLLTGVVTPSGKLTDTWALRYEDFPNAKSFSYQSGDVTRELYEDGIYVGYRYFDSFDRAVEYPFGYGLSYTDFQIEPVTGEACPGQAMVYDAGQNQFALQVRVTNTGAVYAGKETVQMYVSLPQNQLPKEYRRLAAFAKTGLLQPGESQVLELKFSAKDLACFHEDKNAWVAETGQYALWVGVSSRNVKLAAVLGLQEEVLLEQVETICPLQEELQEIAPERELSLRLEKEWLQEAESLGWTAQPLFSQEGIVYRKEILPARAADPKKLAYRKALEEQARKLSEDMTQEELIALAVGEVSKSHNSALGSAGIMVPGSAGETSSILEERMGVPGVPMADGPAGLRLIQTYHVDRGNGQIYGFGFLDAIEGGCFAAPRKLENTDPYYQYCTAFPVGVLLAQTWDISLLEKVGRAVAEEMQEFGIAWWLAPGMNIHRNPLCGRNFEYFAEDPLLSGCVAAAITRGVQSVPGVGTTIKHFACNNQEDNRMGSDSIISQRALREIYLRSFEITIKTSQPMSIMTSYNLVNGVHSANNRDLCTRAAREEWGFEGFIMTDWTTTGEFGGSIPWKCAHAGNDLIMPGQEEDLENLREALRSGDLPEQELRDCAKRLLRVILQTLVFEESRPYGEQFDFM